MKRFHVHVAVDNLEEGIAFYSKAFGAQPTVHKSDYGKKALDCHRALPLPYQARTTR